MKTDRAQRLVGRIGDQYVSMASDAVEAFAQEEARRKSGRAKLRLIAAAAAAMYIIITVAIILSTLPPSEQPVTPPVDDPADPGTQEQPGEPGEPDDSSEPELNLPDAEFFMNYLQGYWAPTFTPDSATTSDIVSNDNSHYSIFHFQPDGRVYIIDVAPQSITGEIGKYSVFGKNIELWTQVQDGWKRSDMSVQVVENENNTSTLNITANGKNQPYACYHETDNHMVLSGGGSYVEYWNAFVEQVSTLSSPSVSFGLPDLDYFKQLPVQTFEETPKLFFSTISSATYKLYNADLALIGEGELQISYENLSTATQNIFPDEQGLYYLDVTMDSHKNLSLYPMHITHFYAAVQINKKEESTPVTPPDNSSEKPQMYYKLTNLCSTWYLNPEDASYPGSVYFAFTDTYQFYMINVETGESVQGEYTFDTEIYQTNFGDITLWVLDDQGTWQKYPLQVQYERDVMHTENCRLHVTDDGETKTYWRQQNQLSNLYIQRYGHLQTYQSKVYLEALAAGGTKGYPYTKVEFDYPGIEVFKNLSPIELDTEDHPIFPMNFGYIAQYTIYRADGTIYEQGEYDFTHANSSHGIPTIPDGRRYYYHIRYDTTQKGTGMGHVVHYYFAIRQEKKPSEPTIPLPEPYVWLTHLASYWSPEWLYSERGEKDLAYHFNFQLDGRVYLVNTDTGEGLCGKYSYKNEKIELWFSQDNGVWKKSDIVITVHLNQTDPSKTTMTVTEGAKQCTYTRIVPNPPELLSVTVHGPDPHEPEGVGLYNFYIQSVDWLDKTISFELPKLTDLRQMEPVILSGAPSLHLNLVNTVQYKLYDQYFRVVKSGDYTISSDKPCLDFPQEAGIYYLVVSCDLNQDFGDGFESRKHYYYLAINYKPPISEYKPPVLGDNRVSIPLLDCDSPLEYMELDTQNALHGSGCASVTFTKGSPVISPNVLTSPIDATGMNMLEFDLYVSDLSLLTGNLFPYSSAALEITSGGTCDYEELFFTWEDIVRYGLAGQELKQGWNHVVFPLSMAKGYSVTEEKFDISQIDFVRFYIMDTSKLGSGEYTVKLDNICLTGEQT